MPLPPSMRRKKTGPKPVDPVLRFWPKVNKNGPIHPVLKTACWLWTGAKVSSGYGEFHLRRGKNKDIQAHVYSYELAFGEVPTGLYVLHKCDVKLCVSPAHLFSGTQKENIQDMHAKGRQATGEQKARVGEKHGLARTTTEEVLAMRKLFDSGETVSQILKQYPNSTYGTIYAAVTRRTWKHL